MTNRIRTAAACVAAFCMLVAMAACSRKNDQTHSSGSPDSLVPTLSDNTQTTADRVSSVVSTTGSMTSSSQAAPSSNAASSSEAVSSPSSFLPVSSAVPSSYTGTYVCAKDGVENQYAPSLALKNNGTFVFRVNMYEHMDSITGTYELIGSTLTLSSLNGVPQGFNCDDVTEIYFRVSGSKLVFSGDDDNSAIGMTDVDDVFTKTTR